MATIASAQSGNWENHTTWVGGNIPTSRDAVIISKGHVVSLNSMYSNYGSMASITVQGELSVAEGITLDIGNASKFPGELVLDGGVLSGAGTLDFKFGTFESTDSAWSFVSIAVITSSTSSRNGFNNWDCKNISFMGGNYTFARPPLQVKGLYSKWKFEHCVFKGTTALNLIKTGAATAPEDSVMKRCTFWNAGGIKIGSGTYRIIFDTCVFFSETVGKGAPNTLSFNGVSCVIKKSAFINTAPFSMKEGYLIEDSFFTHLLSVKACAVSGLASRVGEFRNNYIYAGANVPNNRAINHPKVTGCVVEDRSRGGSNTFYTNRNTIEWTGNILIASADSSSDGMTTMPVSSNQRVNYNISNNTIVNGIGLTSERWPLDPASTFKVANNLQVLSRGVLEDSMFHRTLNGLKALSVEYKNNHAHVQTWIAHTITPIGGLDSNVKESMNTFPQFVDSSRTIEVWAAEHMGGGDYVDVANYMLTLNGYDNATQRHSGAMLSENTIAELVNWFKEGFTPTNMALATAGEGGTYVGALEPKAAPSGLKVVFNGSTMARAFFNGEEIPLDKVKLFLG